VVALVVLAAACGTSETSAPVRNFDIPDTVALGRLPEPLSNIGSLPSPPTTPAATAAPTTEPAPEPVAGAIADSVVGSRVLLIGDAVIASTAPRNEGIMCDVLTSFGWTIEIAAEPGRFIEFGDDVLDQRLEPSDGAAWDVAGVMLGNQFDGDLPAFVRRLEELLQRLSPRPTIVFTLSELDDDTLAVNEIIRALPGSFRNVVVVDWAAVTEANPELLVEQDRPQLTEQGSEVLVLYTAAALGKTLAGEQGAPGECLPEVFTDDSAIVL
jgi:hypothetical protein